MKNIILILIAGFVYSCNSSSTKDPQKALDDTARKDGKINEQTGQGFRGAEKLQLKDIPASLRLTGKATEAWKWNDNLGENILVLTDVQPYDDKRKNEFGEEGQTQEIHATQFLKKGDKYDNIWMLNDEEKACPFDITCKFLPGSTTITDLNKDGVAEIKVQYMTACRSDVSPARMILAIRENEKKYELRGNSWIGYDTKLSFDVNETNVNLELTPRLKDEMEEMTRRMGRYESERQFKTAPPEFLTFARNEWLKYVKEKIGE